jgi:hypothetical protein
MVTHGRSAPLESFTEMTVPELERVQRDLPMPDMDSLMHNIYRWERGTTPSEHYKMLYCDVLGIPPARFGLPEQDSADPGPPAAVLPVGQARTVAIMITLIDGGVQVRVTGPDDSPLPGPPGPGGHRG